MRQFHHETKHDIDFVGLYVVLIAMRLEELPVKRNKRMGNRAAAIRMICKDHSVRQLFQIPGLSMVFCDA